MKNNEITNRLINSVKEARKERREIKMNDDITIWNITFDVDGKLYVLDELKIGTKVDAIIQFLQDYVSMNDIKPIDEFDIRAILGHEGFKEVEE